MKLILWGFVLSCSAMASSKVWAKDVTFLVGVGWEVCDYSTSSPSCTMPNQFSPAPVTVPLDSWSRPDDPNQFWVGEIEKWYVHPSGQRVLLNIGVNHSENGKTQDSSLSLITFTEKLDPAPSMEMGDIADITNIPTVYFHGVAFKTAPKVEVTPIFSVGTKMIYLKSSSPSEKLSRRYFHLFHRAFLF